MVTRNETSKTHLRNFLLHCFLIFMIPCKATLNFFLCLLNYYISPLKTEGRRLNLNFGLLYLKRFKSFLQSHPQQHQHFYRVILNNINIFTESSSTISTFLQSHPQQNQHFFNRNFIFYSKSVVN